MSVYSFTTQWAFDAPVEPVWDAIMHPVTWPEWWRGVETVVELEAGAEDGLGSLHRSTWKSVLPYRLVFDSRVIRVDRFRTCELQATGELEGRGLWTLSPSGAAVHVRYDWNVAPSTWWMRSLAPIARPLFAWNHDVIMRWGEEGLAATLRRARTPRTS